MKKNGSNISSRLLIGILCLFAFGVLFASIATADNNKKKSDEQIHLIHTDILYKNWQDPRADILVGHVRLYHDGGEFL